MEGIGRRGFLKCGLAGAAAAATGGVAHAAAAAGGAAQAAGASGGGRKLRIAHIGDPQLAFGNNDAQRESRYRKHLSRIEKVTSMVNALKPDLAFFAGDMTHFAEDLERDWPRLLKSVKVPWLVVPGNHDTGIPVLRKNVERFRRVFGYDYAAVDAAGWRIIGGNTQYWFGKTDAPELAAEYERWLTAELAKAKSYGGRVIMAGHVAPFASLLNERDGYEACPRAKRSRRLEAYRAAGAKFYLSGHMHRNAVRLYKDMAILSVECTCRNFNAEPYAFRMFEVADDFSYTWQVYKV